LYYFRSEKYAEGHGILEFSTDKAGQDVTPMNLKFDDEAIQTRGSTLNSISGKLIPIDLSNPCFLGKYFITYVNKTMSINKYLQMVGG
jgi:hypothetical protein